MKMIITNIKRTSVFMKEQIRSFFIRHRHVSGVTVIELVLILVKNLALYIACLEGEKSLKNKLYVRHTQ